MLSSAPPRRLYEQRTKNPEFRDYLVNEVAREHVRITRSLIDSSTSSVHSTCCWTEHSELGAGSGLLGYHGGLGNGSSSRTIEAWSALDIDRLRKLFGLGGQGHNTVHRLLAGRKRRCVNRREASGRSSREYRWH